MILDEKNKAKYLILRFYYRITRLVLFLFDQHRSYYCIFFLNCCSSIRIIKRKNKLYIRNSLLLKFLFLFFVDRKHILVRIMSYVPLRSKYKIGTRQSELALIQTERYVIILFSFD